MSSSRFNDLALNPLAVAVMVCFAFIPLGPKLEPLLLPVVEDFQITEAGRTDGEVFIDVTFEKVRPCEFLGLTFYNGPDRVAVNFAPDSGRFPATRPTGAQADRWSLETDAPLGDIRLVTQHRCHFMWTNFQEVWP